MTSDPFEHMLRNIAGAVSTILGIWGGILLAADAFSLSYSKIESVAIFLMAINIGFYAKAYHTSIESSISIRKLCFIIFISTLPASFLMAWLSKVLPL